LALEGVEGVGSVGGVKGSAWGREEGVVVVQRACAAHSA
jgi:hypothetical protein